MSFKIKILPRHQLGLFKVELNQDELDALVVIAEHFEDTFLNSACTGHSGMNQFVEISMLNNEPKADIYICCSSFAERVRGMLHRNRLNGKIHIIRALSPAKTGVFNEQISEIRLDNKE